MDSNQRSELIVRTAAKLSPEDRVRVAERILETQDTSKVRYETLVKAAEATLGRKMDGSRKAASVTIRRFVAWKMRQEGYTFYEIAGAMGVDHSTVHHYIRVMREELELPSVFRNDIELYHVFNDITKYADEGNLQDTEA